MRFWLRCLIFISLLGTAFAAPSDIYTDTTTVSGTYGGDLVPNNPWYTALLNASNASVVDPLFVGSGSNPSTPYYYVYPCTRAMNPYSGGMTQNCTLADLWVSISQNSAIGNGMTYGKQIYNLNAMLNNPNNGYTALRWINWFEWRCNMTIIAQGNWWGYSSWLSTWAQYSLNQYPGKGINQNSSMKILDPSYQTDPATDYNGYVSPWFYPWGAFGWGWGYSPGTMNPPNGGANFLKVSGRTMPQYNANYSRFYYNLFMLPTNPNYSQNARNAASVGNQATVQYNTNDPSRLIITRAVGSPFTFFCESDALFPSGSDYRAWFRSYGNGQFQYLSPNFTRYYSDYPSMMSRQTRYSSAYPNFSYMGTLTNDNGANGQFVEIPLTFLTVNGNRYQRRGGTQVPQTSLQPDAATNAKNPTAFRLTVMNYDTASGSDPATLDRLLQTAGNKLTPRGWQNLSQPVSTSGGAAPIDISGAMGGLLPPTLKTSAFLSNDNQFLCTLVAMSLPSPFIPYAGGPSFPTLVIAQVTLNQSNINPNATASGSASSSSSTTTSSSASSSSSSSASSSTSSGFSASASNSASSSSSASASASSSAAASSSASDSSSSSASSGDSSSASNSASISISSSQSSSDSASASSGESSSSANSASISISSSMSTSSSASDSSSSSTSSGASTSTANSQSTSLSSSISTSSGDGSASASASQGDSSSNSNSTSTSSGASNSVSTTLSSSRSTTSSTSTSESGSSGDGAGAPGDKEKGATSPDGGTGSTKSPEESDQEEHHDPKRLRPFTLSAATLDEKSVRLAWLYPQSDATGFEIERRDRRNPDATWNKIAQLSDRESNYLDTKLPKDFDFLYRVLAKTPKGSEVISQEASAKPYAAQPQLDGTHVKNGFQLNWNFENASVKEWKIERAASSLGPWNTVATVKGDQSNYVDSSAFTGYYRIMGTLSTGTTIYSQRIPSFSSEPSTPNSKKP